MKVKPSKGGQLRRRTVTISFYALCWLALTLLAPLWIPVTLVIGVVRRRSFVIFRALGFAWLYFGLELIALLLVAWLFLTRRGESRASALYSLQAWWASVNLRAARRALRLDIQVEGAELAAHGPMIVLVRHASILDTLLPCAFVQRPYGLRLRYILKQELLFDPCIDIVGNALPNYFVDRTGNRGVELDGIRRLSRDLGSDGVLIFPEGTRFSPEKRRRALEKLASEDPSLAEAAGDLTHVLPPKPGGVLTLFDALPGVDCVVLAHSGLERFSKIVTLLDGAVVDSVVRVKLWRIAADEIPKDDRERLRWLYSQWTEVDEFVKNPVPVGG